MDDKYKILKSGEALNELLLAGGQNEFMRNVLRDMNKRIADVKKTYFKKPVISIPFGLSIEHGTKLARMHPELREIMYEPHTAMPDGLFLAGKHMAVRKALLSLLGRETSLVEDKYAQSVITTGIDLVTHSFVWRTAVPIQQWEYTDFDSIGRYYTVVDLLNSHVPLHDLLSQWQRSSVSDNTIIVPYDSYMWKHVGGRNSAAGFTYFWSNNNESLQYDYMKPIKLPGKFFLDDEYSSWRLYVQPDGSTTAFTLTRHEFLSLYGGYNYALYHEVRITKFGFAEVNFIRSIDFEQPVKYCNDMPYYQYCEPELPMGSTMIPRLHDTDTTYRLKPGRHYDLHTILPCFVRSTFYERAVRLMFTLKVGREIIPAMVRTLHTNSARAVYNGAIVVADEMIDSESLCVVLEAAVSSHIDVKTQLSAVTNLARTPHAAGPRDHAKAIVLWAAEKAIASTDIQAGVKKVSNYLQSVASSVHNPNIKPEFEADDDLMHSMDKPIISSEKEQNVIDISDYVEDVFGYNFSAPYELTRKPIMYHKPDLIQLRMHLLKSKKRYVSVEAVQAIYDDLFPGNSLIFPTENQLELNKADYRFVIDVQSFKMSIPAMFDQGESYKGIPSTLRTSVGADLVTSSFRSLMGSLMKRNFNRPRPEAMGSRKQFVTQVINQAMLLYGHKRAPALREYYQRNKIVVTGDVVALWAANHDTSDVLAAVTMLNNNELDPSQFRLMPKDVPKPAMSTTAQGSVAVGQTVVYHSKDIIALTAGMFTIIISRLLTYFDDNIRFAFGADEHTSGEWADKYLNMDGMETYVSEIDIPKFDKSQDWTCYELVLQVMKLVGLDDTLIDFWRKASDKATVFSSLFNLTFTTMFGNRSGNAGTLATNCIVILFAFLSTYRSAGIKAILIKGDDSVLVTKRPLEPHHTMMLEMDWGFSMKLLPRKGNVTSFCSSFFVKDSENHYRLVRDIARVVEKLGRALTLAKPASYFIDYYVALVDTALMYEDDIVVQNLSDAIHCYYGKPVDVVTLVEFVRYISSSSEVFLSHLYGLSQSQIEKMRNFDEVEEILLRTKSSKFIKAKQLADGHRQVKLSLFDKMKMSADWYFD